MSKLLTDTINQIKPLNKQAKGKAQERQDRLTKPQGSLGRLEELSIQLAGIQGKSIPQIKHKTIIVMAGDHGVIAEKVGNWLQEVTAQMVLNFLSGGAGIPGLRVSHHQIPFVAIGGIKEGNVADVIKHGATYICMVTEIVANQNIGAKIQSIRAQISKAMGRD